MFKNEAGFAGNSIRSEATSGKGGSTVKIPGTPGLTTSPPLSGLPETFHGKPLAWTWPGTLDPWRCVCCGRVQAEYLDRKDVEAVLCGRCFMILADDAPEAEDPLSPEERAAVTQRKRRHEARGR